mgnify:CR=1 FL=1
MFTRPNWRDKTQYEWLLSDSTSLQQLAWEFLRRSPQYWACVYLFWKSFVDVGPFDGLEFDARLIDSGMEYDPATLERWSLKWSDWWKVRRPATPSDDEGWLDFVSTIDDAPEEYLRIDGRITGPKVLMPVDLALPLEVTIARLQDEIRELRERGIRCGLVRPQLTRVQSRDKYVDHFRILDAVADIGANYTEIGCELMPNAVNDPADKQRDKRVRAAHTAALEMADGGYKNLLDRDTPFT